MRKNRASATTFPRPVVLRESKEIPNTGREPGGFGGNRLSQAPGRG